MRCRLQLAVSVAVVCVALTSCRDGVPPYSPEEFEFGSQLTFGIGQDLHPAWLPDGSALLYHTDHHDTYPLSDGVLLRIPAEGGVATPILNDAQQGFDRELVAPVMSPDSRRIAYVHLITVDTVAACDTQLSSPTTANCVTTQPRLGAAVLRVREVGSSRPLDQDAALTVALEGTDAAYRAGAERGTVLLTRALPFQMEFRLFRTITFRPTWAPDNQRLAFASGMQLFVWRVGDAAAAAIPGTNDAVSAAWSPDGERIAFTQLVRGDSSEIRCVCATPGESDRAGPVSLVHRRMTYDVIARRLVVIRPDGGDRIELGEGEDPAWSPDGQFLYARRNNELVRIAVNGGAATVVAGTTGARFPAVSPDGRRIVFSRLKNSAILDFDLWVINTDG